VTGVQTCALPIFPGACRVDAAGIDSDRTAAAAEQFPQRSLVSFGVEVPQRKIYTGDGLSEGTGLARLQRQDGSALRQLLENCRWFDSGESDCRGCQDLIDQPCAMLCAVGGEVAPGLAPARKAVVILDVDKHRR